MKRFDPKPVLNTERFEACFKAIDAHTEGEFCRVVYAGFPEGKGDTILDRKYYLQEHYDEYRKALMLEPRGHHDMFGAVLGEPINPEADFAVYFCDTGGWLNMCGHCTIGAVTVALETGMVECKEGVNYVNIDAPAGLVKTEAIVENGKVLSVTLTNVPAFLYKENLEVEIDGRKIKYDISFGGSFFALVDTQQESIQIDINAKTVPALTDIGMKMMEIINKTVEIKHPELDITTVDLVEFYGPAKSADANKQNVVIFGEAQADRSPCGTGTSAKLATLYARGEIGIDEPFVYESFMCTKFIGRVKEETTMGPYKAVVPQVTGAAYLTGEATYAIDPLDKLGKGFIVG